MRQTNVRGSLSLRGFRKLRTGAIVATGVILLGLGFLAPTVSASEQDGVWVARTVAEVKADLQKEGDLFKYVIKWGDTLSVISEASNIPVDVLQEMNQASGKNLFLPHNELYFTEAETVSDTVTKHKIVIKESGASGEVRTYEVLLKKDQETKAVTFELTDVTEKVEKMTVNYSSVYQPVSAPVVERAEESGEGLAPVAPAVTSPEVKEETAAPVAPKAEDAATTPAPKETAPEVVTPAPKEEKPATSAPKEEKPAIPEAAGEGVKPTPKEDASEGATGTEVNPAPNEAGTTEEGKEAKETEESEANPAEPNAETPTPKVEEPATPAPKEEKSATPATKVEEPTESSEPKTEAPTTPENKEEQPGATEATEPEVTESEVAKPTESNAEAATESTEASGTSAETTPDGTVESESAPKENAPEGIGSEASGEETGATVETGTTTEEGTSGGTGEASEAPSGDEGKDSKVGDTDKETGSKEEGKAETTEEPATTEPKAEELTSEEAKAKKELADAQKDGEDIINERVSSKLGEIEKVKDEAEKEKLKAELKTLKEDALAAINNAKDHDAAVAAADEYQTKIDEINVPGEELPAPNYNKDNLTNGRNEGTTINDGSTAIGHGSGEAPATTPAQPATTERSTSPTTPTQPSSTSEGASSFRNAPSVQARARRVARSTSEPDGTVNISYNFAEMPDIHGFLSDPGEDNTVTIPAGTSEAQAKELVKEKIQAKIKDLAARGYHVKNDIIFEQDTTVKNYNYVVTFTKETTGASGFRMAPAVQPRASRNRRSLEQPAPQKVKVNVFYNFDKMKDIAGFLGDINGTSLEIAEGLSNEQVKSAVKSQVDAKKEELRKHGYTFKEDYVYQANGKDYNYVVTFSKAAK